MGHIEMTGFIYSISYMEETEDGGDYSLSYFTIPLDKWKDEVKKGEEVTAEINEDLKSKPFSISSSDDILTFIVASYNKEVTEAIFEIELTRRLELKEKLQ